MDALFEWFVVKPLNAVQIAAADTAALSDWTGGFLTLQLELETDIYVQRNWGFKDNPKRKLMKTEYSCGKQFQFIALYNIILHTSNTLKPISYATSMERKQ